MATAGERLATIEASLRELRDDVKHLRDTIEGGDGIEWERSVKGELHKIKGTLSSFVIRRSVGMGMLKSWQAAILLVCAVGTVVAAWYGVLHG